MDGWKIDFLLGSRPIFRGENVRLPEGKWPELKGEKKSDQPITDPTIWSTVPGEKNTFFFEFVFHGTGSIIHGWSTYPP